MIRPVKRHRISDDAWEVDGYDLTKFAIMDWHKNRRNARNRFGNSLYAFSYGELNDQARLVMDPHENAYYWASRESLEREVLRYQLTEE